MLRRFPLFLAIFALFENLCEIKCTDKVVDDMDFTVLVRLAPSPVLIRGYFYPVCKLA
ncbi:MAG: hypothetical protein FWG34_13640 [Oscillospiraceae bacterium]|nr:hypothetical protein [Oscillospiraceae bacterium]